MGIRSVLLCVLAGHSKWTPEGCNSFFSLNAVNDKGHPRDHGEFAGRKNLPHTSKRSPSRRARFRLATRGCGRQGLPTRGCGRQELPTRDCGRQGLPTRDCGRQGLPTRGCGRQGLPTGVVVGKNCLVVIVVQRRARCWLRLFRQPLGLDKLRVEQHGSRRCALLNLSHCLRHLSEKLCG